MNLQDCFTQGSFDHEPENYDGYKSYEGRIKWEDPQQEKTYNEKMKEDPNA